MTPSDTDLLHRYRGSGDLQALDMLVKRHLPKIRAIIYPIVGNEVLTDDLTQETFLKAIRSLGQFENRSEFGTWLCRIAINLCRDHFRRKPKVSVEGGEALERVASPRPVPTEVIEGLESIDEIQTAIMELPEAWRSALTLVCIQGMKPADAAEVLECSLATLYWRIHQSRKRLGKKLSRHL